MIIDIPSALLSAAISLIAFSAGVGVKYGSYKSFKEDTERELKELKGQMKIILNDLDADREKVNENFQRSRTSQAHTDEKINNLKDMFTMIRDDIKSIREDIKTLIKK